MSVRGSAESRMYVHPRSPSVALGLAGLLPILSKAVYASEDVKDVQIKIRPGCSQACYLRSTHNTAYDINFQVKWASSQGTSTPDLAMYFKGVVLQDRRWGEGGWGRACHHRH